MMEAAATSETSVNFYQTTRRNNPEDNHLHSRRRENLKSHKVNEVSVLITYLLLYEFKKLNVNVLLFFRRWSVAENFSSTSAVSTCTEFITVIV
jgi:hypothetical protein